MLFVKTKNAVKGKIKVLLNRFEALKKLISTDFLQRHWQSQKEKETFLINKLITDSPIVINTKPKKQCVGL